MKLKKNIFDNLLLILAFLTLSIAIFIILSEEFFLHPLNLDMSTIYFENKIEYRGNKINNFMNAINNIAGNNNDAVYNQTLRSIQAGLPFNYNYPDYDTNPGATNQPHAAMLAAQLEDARLNGKGALTKYVLDNRGHTFLAGYIQATDPDKFDTVYGRCLDNPNLHPSYWQLNINKTLINNLKNVN